MATPRKKTASDYLAGLDTIHTDTVEVHIASPVDNDTCRRQFAAPAARCRTHANCVLIKYRPVARR